MPAGAGQLLDPPGDHLPQAEQVGHVAGELALGAVAAGGADDEAHALGRVQFEHDVAQPAADGFVLDLPRDADAAQGGHEHQVAAGDADVGRERRPLGADALLDDLHEHFVAAAEDFLDRRLEARPAAEAVVARPLGARLRPLRRTRRPRPTRRRGGGGRRGPAGPRALSGSKPPWRKYCGSMSLTCRKPLRPTPKSTNAAWMLGSRLTTTPL